MLRSRPRKRRDSVFSKSRSNRGSLGRRESAKPLLRPPRPLRSRRLKPMAWILWWRRSPRRKRKRRKGCLRDGVLRNSP